MRKFKVSLEKGLSPSPYKHELAAAGIIADYLKSDILFLRRNPNASPDLLVEKTNQIWELKSPIGNGKRTIANNLRNASHQSKKVIIDLSRCKMNNSRALSRINEYSKKGNPNIKKLLIIDKKGHVVDNILQIK